MPFSDTTLAILAVLLAFGTGGGFVALWIQLGSRIASAESKAERAEKVADKVRDVADAARASADKAAAAEAMALHTSARIEMLGKEVQDYRLESAKSVARLTAMLDVNVVSLRDTEERLTRSIDGMSKRFEDFNRRVDGIMARGMAPELGG